MPGEAPRQAGKVDSGRNRDSGIAAPASGEAPSFTRRSPLPKCLSRSLQRPLLWASAGSPVLVAGLAHAQETQARSLFSFSTVEVMQLAMFAGVMGAALLSAIFLIRERARTAAENVELRSRVADLNAAIQRSEALLNLRDQRVIVWNNDSKKPELIGTLPAESGAPDERASFLAFGRWLMPRSAAALENAVAALRERGIAFDLVIEAQNGAPLEVQGRKSAAHIIVRFLSLSESQRMQARLKLDNQRLAANHETMLGLIDALNMPFWIRAKDGRLRWVNRAYAAAVEASDAGGRGARRQGTARHAGARGDRQAASDEAGLRPVAVDRDRRRPPRLRGDRFRRRRGLGGHRGRQERDRSHPRRIRAHGAEPRRYARPADHRGRDLRRAREAALLQPGFPEALGARPRLPRQRAGQCASDRQAAQRGQDRRAAGMAALEGEPALGLPLGRVRRSTGGICPTAAPSASSPTRSPRAASPGCSRT